MSLVAKGTTFQVHLPQRAAAAAACWSMVCQPCCLGQGWFHRRMLFNVPLLQPWGQQSFCKIAFEYGWYMYGNNTA
jgi:hypothetical protein